MRVLVNRLMIASHLDRLPILESIGALATDLPSQLRSQCHGTYSKHLSN